MARVISYRIVAKDKFTAVANKVNRSAKGLKATLNHVKDAAKKADRAFVDLGKSISSAGKKLSIMSAGIVAFGVAAVVASSKQESLLRSFQAMTGSAEVGSKLLKDLYGFASRTPFEIEGLGSAARLLLATGTEAENMISTLQLLGDLASNSGGDVKGLALVYSQIRATPTLKSQDANQLAARGINIYKGIADRLSTDGNVITVAQVREGMMQGLVSSALAIDVLKQMNKEGGIAFRAMEIQSATIGGKWSNLKDEASQVMEVIGKVLVQHLGLHKILERIAGSLSWLKDNLKRITDENPKLTKMVLIFTGLFVALGPALIIVGGLIQGFAMLSILAGALSIGMLPLTLTILAIGAAIAAVVAAAVALYVYWDDIVNYFNSTWDNFINKINNADAFSVVGIIKKGLELTGVIESKSTSESVVDVNLNAPAGVVRNFRSSSSGPTNLNVGMNMVGAR